MPKHNRIFTVGLLAMAAPCASAQTTAPPGDLGEKVVVTTGGEYVSYPPAKIVNRTGGVTEYVIDMNTALFDRLLEREERTVSMTWRRSGSKHTICFKHQKETRCRDLGLALDYVAPTFKPTLIDHWPTVYVRFTDASGNGVWIEYSAGEILTPDEQAERLRTESSVRPN